MHLNEKGTGRFTLTAASGGITAASAGREVSVQKWFQWAGCGWFVPSVYVCAKGEAAQGKLRTACSALRFAAADHADWRVGFRETPWEEGTFGLI